MLNGVQAIQNSMKPYSIGKFQRLTDQLISRFSNSLTVNPRFPMPSARLELTDQVKMTQLEHPMVSMSQLFGTAKIVANHGANASSEFGRNGFDESHPSFQAFCTVEKQ